MFGERRSLYLRASAKDPTTESEMRWQHSYGFPANVITFRRMSAPAHSTDLGGLYVFSMD